MTGESGLDRNSREGGPDASPQQPKTPGGVVNEIVDVAEGNRKLQENQDEALKKAGAQDLRSHRLFGGNLKRRNLLEDLNGVQEKAKREAGRVSDALANCFRAGV